MKLAFRNSLTRQCHRHSQGLHTIISPVLTHMRNTLHTHEAAIRAIYQDSFFMSQGRWRPDQIVNGLLWRYIHYVDSFLLLSQRLLYSCCFSMLHCIQTFLLKARRRFRSSSGSLGRPGPGNCKRGVPSFLKP